MISEEFLDKGLTALGRCCHAPWDAHFAAAVLAGFYFSSNNCLSAVTERNLEAQLRLLIRTKPALFEPYARNGRVADAFGPVVEALETSVDKLSELGHNCIFSAYALRALKDLDAFRHDEAIRDIATVIRTFHDGPARYWLRIRKGHDPRKLSIPHRTIFTDNLPAPAMARTILSELPKFEHVYTQMGSKSHIGHLLTQSQALVTLQELGFPELANRGSYSLECRFLLLKDSQPHQSSPLSFYTPATRSALLPTEPAYWLQDFTHCEWDEGHVFKYTFSFHELLNRSGDPELNQCAAEKFRYLISPNERSKST